MRCEDRKARIAVVGTGWWATYAHLPALAQRPDVELVALSNRGEAKLRLAADTFRVAKAYTDFHEMLDENSLDGVVIAASHVVHYEAAKAALEHDCHVLIEKPMVLRSDEALEMTNLARRRNKAIVMSYPWGYTSHTRRAREVVRSGNIGEIEMISSLFSSFAYETYRGDADTLDNLFGDGGVVEVPVVKPRYDANNDPNAGGGQGYCQMTHSAGLVFWVTGLAAQQVSAYMSRLDTQVDVVDAVSMRLTNGAVGVISSTGHIRPGDPGEHILAVYGSKGSLTLDMIAGTLTIKRDDATVETWDALPEDDRYPRSAPANNFIDVILYGAENLAPGVIGSETVYFLDAAYRSAAEGGIPVQVFRP